MLPDCEWSVIHPMKPIPSVPSRSLCRLRQSNPPTRFCNRNLGPSTGPRLCLLHCPEIQEGFMPQLHLHHLNEVVSLFLYAQGLLQLYGNCQDQCLHGPSLPAWLTASPLTASREGRLLSPPHFESSSQPKLHPRTSLYQRLLHLSQNGYGVSS